MTTVAESSALLDDVLRDVGRLARLATDLWSGGPPRRDDLTALRPAIARVLADNLALVAGAGIAVGPGGLADLDRHLEWWWTGPAGGPEALRVNLDPTAPDFYDFAAEEWYQVAADELAPVVAGPYVDYACTNDYALTVAHPVVAGGVMVAVAAADVPVAALEARVLPMLAADGAPRLLASGHGRVVLSTAPDLPTGARLESDVLDGGRALDRAPLRDWRLVELGR